MLVANRRVHFCKSCNIMEMGCKQLETLQTKKMMKIIRESYQKSRGAILKFCFKGKGVHIDYATVVPHVDFGGEERISRDLESIVEEKELSPAASGDVMAQIFGDVEERKEEETYFVREILRGLINSVVGLDEDVMVDLKLVHQKDSPIDNFVPMIEEKEEPLYNRAAPSSGIAQEELEKELKEAKEEVLMLTRTSRTSTERSKTSINKSRKEKSPSTQKMETDKEQKEVTEAVEKAEGEEALKSEAPVIEVAPEAEAPAVEAEAPAEVEAEAPPEVEPVPEQAEPEVEIKAEEAPVEEEAIKVEEPAVEEPPQAEGDIQEDTVD